MQPSPDPGAPTPFRLLTLGGATVVDATGTVVVEQRRRLALLALVGSAQDRGISRDKVLSHLNPENSTGSARHALHQLLYYLRQQVREDVFLGTDPLRLNPHVITADFSDFDTAIGQRRFDEAVALYRGPFLDGLHLDSVGFEEWLDGQRRRLAARYCDCLVWLARDATARDDRPAAIGLWRQLTGLEPMSGPYAVGLMRALAAADDTTGALRHARIHESLVRAELGTSCDAEVRSLASQLARDFGTPASRPSASPRIRRLAVLPLESTANDSPTNEIAEALTRELISALTVAGVRVIGYQSVARLAGGNASLSEIAKALDVDGVATGRLDRRGRIIAIALDVVSPLSGENLWATSIAVEPSAFAGLAKAAADRLAMWIVGGDASRPNERQAPAPLPSAEAYTSYLLGMRRAERATASDMRQAIVDLERAIVADESFAPAYAGLAYAVTIAIDYAILPAHEAFRRAEPAIARALVLDDKLALAHLAKARVLQLRDWNWKGAEAAYSRAIELEPSPRAFSTYGWFLEWYVGRAAEGVAMGERAVSLDPTSVWMHSALAWRLRGAGHLDRAIDEAHIALALDATASDANWILAEVYLRRSDFERAEHHAREYLLVSGDEVPANSTTLGEIYARTGRFSDARAHAARLALRAARDGPSLVALARTEMALGNTDSALSLLEQAVAQHVFTIPFQPYWDPIRGESRFKAVVRAQGL